MPTPFRQSPHETLRKRPSEIETIIVSHSSLSNCIFIIISCIQHAHCIESDCYFECGMHTQSRFTEILLITLHKAISYKNDYVWPTKTSVLRDKQCKCCETLYGRRVTKVLRRLKISVRILILLVCATGLSTVNLKIWRVHVAIIIARCCSLASPHCEVWLSIVRSVSRTT